MTWSYACARVTPITVWVVSKNESNCLLEDKMVSTLIWRQGSDPPRGSHQLPVFLKYSVSLKLLVQLVHM